VVDAAESAACDAAAIAGGIPSRALMQRAGAAAAAELAARNRVSAVG
jgi:NAD(P)H-hydrate repair Nnr-like enzyme with NAD(P)H-hydrate epimerase domain